MLEWSSTQPRTLMHTLKCQFGHLGYGAKVSRQWVLYSSPPTPPWSKPALFVPWSMPTSGADPHNPLASQAPTSTQYVG